MQLAAARWAAVVAVACVAECLKLNETDADRGAAPSPDLPVVEEAWHDGWHPAHLAIILTLLVTAALLCGAVILRTVQGQGTPLSVLMFAMSFSAVAVTGTVTWAVSYHNTLHGVESETTSFARAALARASAAVERHLDVIPLRNALFADEIYAGTYNATDLYPTAVLRAAGHMRAYESYSSSARTMTWTTEAGYSIALSRSHPSPDRYLRYIVPPGGAFPNGFRCDDPDAPSVCDACRRNATLQNACAGACAQAPCRGAAAAPRAATFRIPNWTAPLPEEPALHAAAAEDPRTAPPFSSAHDGHFWTRPYVREDPFAALHGYAGPAAPEVALTASLKVYAHPRGTGTVEERPMPAGVVSTEVAVSDLVAVLTAMAPTKAARFALADYDGTVVAGTMAPADLFAPVPAGNGTVAIRPAAASLPFVNEAFAVLQSRYGAYSGAKGKVSVLHATMEGGWRLLAAQPLNITGLELLLVLVVPYADVLQDAYDASTETLLIILCVSFGLCVVVRVFVMFVVVPLDEVGRTMDAVTRMDEVPGAAVRPSSRIGEIARLQAACAVMAHRLALVRPYLPQHVFVDSDAETDMNGAASAGQLDDGSLAGGSPCGSVMSSRCSSTLSRTSSVLSAGGSRRGQSALFNRSSRALKRPPRVQRNDNSAGSLPLDSPAATAPPASPSGQTRVSMVDPGAGAGTGVFSRAVESRVVGVLCLSLRGYHDFCGENYGGYYKLEHDDVANFTTDYWELVRREVSQTHGVVEVAMGDRVLASYNASRFTRKRGQPAVCAALRIRAGLPRIFQQDSLSVGVAVGSATVGNLGCSVLMRFNLLGTCVPQAVALEGLTRWYTHQGGPGASILTTPRVALDSDCSETTPLDLVELPFARKPIVVAAVLAEREGCGEDDWLYVVQTGAKPASPDLWSIFNDLSRGHHERAWSRYQDIKADSPAAPGDAEPREAVFAAALHNIRALTQQRALCPQRDFGAYYAHGVLGGRGTQDDAL
eukprot:TRINITY_DN5848_c0_g3_i1.p1 TRINITY_DN5848_c0_g3~~TRINITY_DN5848_c0_g3_i1.p1  ORF type:complete len:994 (+),score=196.45 TRINITY_DN5848_c0_g3_i1:112-3093(+)